jgi:hypothetical protein
MKTKLIFLVLLIVCFSCGINNKPVSDTQKEKIKGEVKEVTNAMFKGCEEANFDMAVESFLDSPDFVYIYNGVSLNYKGVVDGIKPLFSELINQKVTLTDEKYVFLDKSTVIYTTNCKFLENYKDGHAILSDPMVVQVTYKKIDNKWKAINGVESSVRQNVKNSGNLEGLTQVELSKYFLGTWQCEIAKDTYQVCAYKLLGTGMEANIKIVTKGKTVQEGKLLYGYDKKSDKFIQIFVMSGSDMDVRAFWFTSKNTGEGVLLKDISNPDNANIKMKFEIKSPDLWVATAIENTKTIGTSTYTRVKN